MESVRQFIKEDVGPLVERELQEEDLSRTCRRDHYCARCGHAFCSHCCYDHHPSAGFHVVIPVGLDAAGQPAFPTHYPGWSQQRPIEDYIVDDMVAQDYVTPLTRDAYCLKCRVAFCAGVCYHHLYFCGRDLILRIEEHGGGHYVRCRGDEGWFARVERILGDPVGEDDDNEMMLLPLLRRKPGTCVQCGGPVACPALLRCSPACATSHNRELALRRERRDARRAARQLAKLRIDGSN